MTRFKHWAAVAAIGATLGAGVLALPAFAEESWISWSQLTKQLEEQGFRIHELKIRRLGWKAEVTDSRGRRLDLRLNERVDIVREKLDD